MSAQKVRLVADQIRGLGGEDALDVLNFSTKAASTPVRKSLESAIANAEHNDGADVDELKVSTDSCERGSDHEAYPPRAKGRADRIFKRTCHITVTDD